MLTANEDEKLKKKCVIRYFISEIIWWRAFCVDPLCVCVCVVFLLQLYVVKLTKFVFVFFRSFQLPVDYVSTIFSPIVDEREFIQIMSTVNETEHFFLINWVKI